MQRYMAYYRGAASCLVLQPCPFLLAFDYAQCFYFPVLLKIRLGLLTGSYARARTELSNRCCCPCGQKENLNPVNLVVSI